MSSVETFDVAMGVLLWCGIVAALGAGAWIQERWLTRRDRREPR